MNCQGWPLSSLDVPARRGEKEERKKREKKEHLPLDKISSCQGALHSLRYTKIHKVLKLQLPRSRALRANHHRSHITHHPGHPWAQSRAILCLLSPPLCPAMGIWQGARGKGMGQRREAIMGISVCTF